MAGESTTQGGTGKRFGYLAMTLVLLLGVVAGSMLVVGIGVYRHHAMGWGPGGWGHHGMMRGWQDPDLALGRMERMVAFAARRLDATPEQEARLAAIATAAAKDLQPFRAKMRDARARARQILTAPTIDRGALEALRAEQLANADAASRRLAQAMADAADVLTPAQRARLARRFGF